VVLYEKPKGTGEPCVCRVHHASSPRATFMAGIRDATRQALMVLHHQYSTVLHHTKYHHFLLKETNGSDAHVNDKVWNDLTGRLGE
jgi:hypothetical protein